MRLPLVMMSPQWKNMANGKTQFCVLAEKFSLEFVSWNAFQFHFHEFHDHFLFWTPSVSLKLHIHLCGRISPSANFHETYMYMQHKNCLKWRVRSLPHACMSSVVAVQDLTANWDLWLLQMRWITFFVEKSTALADTRSARSQKWKIYSPLLK